MDTRFNNFGLKLLYVALFSLTLLFESTEFSPHKIMEDSLFLFLNSFSISMVKTGLGLSLMTVPSPKLISSQN